MSPKDEKNGLDPICMVLDNGSLRASSVLNLRKIAESLGIRLNRRIFPVSLLHSNKIDPEDLEGEAASVFEPFVRELLEQGYRQFRVLPLFFGPSAAITDYLPKRIRVLKEKFPDLEVQVAPCLVNTQDESENEELFEALKDRVLESIEGKVFDFPLVALVDHGTPVREVNQVRDFVAEALGKRLGGYVDGVFPCSMERRPDSQYDFNEPLLENWFKNGVAEGREVIVSLLFLSPGRHAGEGGDIDQICQRAREEDCAAEIVITETLGSHPRFCDFLEKQFKRSLLSD